jgi:nitroimidazol reductase NimA-like FMN-containing flavoprotein (pyridoxamine 5'-phosphate oxidase superfamily)
MIDKEIKKVNRAMRKHLGEGKLEEKIEKLVKDGVLEIIGCDDDGFPIVTPTEKGMQIFRDNYISV